jgi:hypothetical protein
VLSVAAGVGAPLAGLLVALGSFDGLALAAVATALGALVYMAAMTPRLRRSAATNARALNGELD